MNRKVMSEYLDVSLDKFPARTVQSTVLSLPYKAKVLQLTNDSDGPKIWLEFDFNHEFSVEPSTIWIAQSYCLYFPEEATTYLGSFHETELSYEDMKFEYYWHVYSDGSLTRV